MSDDEKKIVIDEDWKSQVERERQEAQAAEPASEPREEEIEELSIFDNLVASLSAQTLMSLGLVAQEDEAEVYIDFNSARQLIDILMMLREKTEGNLTDVESANLKEAVGELQRVFTARVQQSQEAPTDLPGGPEIATPQ